MQNNLIDITHNVVKELELGCNKKNTSFPFIVHNLSSNPLVADDEVFQVLVIGGTICKKALMVMKKGKLVTLSRDEKEQPPLISKEAFFSFLEHEIDKTVKIVALNFAYPMKPVFEDGKLDGVLVSGSKENTFEGLVGKQVGKEIEKFIKQKQGRQIRVSTANDTICLILSGLTEFPWNTIAGGIVGTGLNFAIFLDEHTVVNLESANFDKFPQSREGKTIDKQSAQPGDALLEKETSGAYLYRHYNLRIDEEHLDIPKISATWEMKRLARRKTEEGKLAKELLDYSARLIATQIAGITLFHKKDTHFVMEGSFFWEGEMYKNMIKEYLRDLIPQYTVTFVRIEDSPILGAAKLVA